MLTTDNSKTARSAADAARLRALHEGPRPLVLPNAWDATSAAIVAAAGAPAVATTSGGISWPLGAPDGHGLSRELAVEAIERIVAAVPVPVTADIEGGYGPGPEDVATTVTAIVVAGAAGINLEDSAGPGGTLLAPALQAERISAARAAGGGRR